MKTKLQEDLMNSKLVAVIMITGFHFLPWTLFSDEHIKLFTGNLIIFKLMKISQVATT